MTALSPRLAHLLIQEDRSTGRLILPEGMAPKDAPGLSPPLSPMPFAFSALPPIDPLHKPLPGVGSLLPPPRTGSSRVASHSLMSILNNDIDSPPSSASSSIGPSRYYQTRRSPSPVSPMSYPSSVPYHLQPRGSHDLGPGPSRPVLPRRHSDHPSEPAPFRPRPSDPYTPISGSRAPISRTTKACNACRARKVRCDAGGGGEPSTCSRCKEGGISCVYAGAQKKRGPCPGSVRPSSRSVKSVTNTYVKTPEEEEDTHGRRRSSYGFPNYDRPVTPRSAGHPYSFAHEQYRASSPWQSRKPSIAQTPVLSWPAMRPATDEDDLPLKYFGDNYSMGPMDRQESRGMRVEVHRRDSYYQRP